MNSEAAMTLASDLRRWLRIRDGETLFVYEAGNGALVDSFRRMGIQAWGSSSTLNLGGIDPQAQQWMSEVIPAHSYAYVLALDFSVENKSVLKELLSKAWTSMVFNMGPAWSYKGLAEWMEYLMSISSGSTISAHLNLPFTAKLYFTCRKPQ